MRDFLRLSLALSIVGAVSFNAGALLGRQPSVLDLFAPPAAPSYMVAPERELAVVGLQELCDRSGSLTCTFERILSTTEDEVVYEVHVYLVTFTLAEDPPGVVHQAVAVIRFEGGEFYDYTVR